MPTAVRRTLEASLLGATLLLGMAQGAAALTITTSYADSVNSLAHAAEVKSAFQAAAGIYEAMFVTPVNVNIHVGWGEVLGQAVTTIGVAHTNGFGSYGYGALKAILAATATSAHDRIAYAALPAASPAGALNYTLTPALARALGMAPATSTAIDGHVGFGLGYAFDFDRADGIAPDSYDFIGVALHEISHVLGRISGVAATSVAALPLDLFRYAAARTPGYASAAPAYLAIDGGHRPLARFNAAGPADRTDWTDTAGDAFSARAHPGVINDLTLADRIVMDVLGWNTVPGTATPAHGGGVAPGGATTPFFVNTQDAIGSFSQGRTAVTEPGGIAILGSAFLGLGLAIRRRGA
jgi:hypothetical protein